MNSSICYHCGEAIPPHTEYFVDIFGEPRPMCCRGCEFVAETIVDNGLINYYQHRTALGPKPLIPSELNNFSYFDQNEVQKYFVKITQSASDHSKNTVKQDSRKLKIKSVPDKNIATRKEAIFVIEGIVCPVCSWLIEKRIEQLTGVSQIIVNYTTKRARIIWDEQVIHLSQILFAIAQMGYSAHPFHLRQTIKTKKQALKRLAIAGLTAGQVMMMTSSILNGNEIDFSQQQLLRWFSLLLSVPAVIYSAMPFYVSAWRSLKNRQITMEVPVSLGLIIGFWSSLLATFWGQGSVYFDTLTTLIFFLLGTRYLEQSVREKSIEATENLYRIQPLFANKIVGGKVVLVPPEKLKIDDRVLVKAGETIPIDGQVMSDEILVDESMLTGEAEPVRKQENDIVYAGSINRYQVFTLKVTKIAQESFLANISRLLDKAISHQTKFTSLSNKIATYFTSIQLTIALIVGLIWYFIQADRAIEIVLSVLIVSCPCALSLAEPSVLATTMSVLFQRGVLVLKSEVIEKLSKMTELIFDKTGTLTQGRPELKQIITLANLKKTECLKIAASLEQGSEHVLAKLFLSQYKKELFSVSNSQIKLGKGMQGKIEGRLYHLGNQPSFPTPDIVLTPRESIVYLWHDEQILCAFVIEDSLRSTSATLIKQLQKMGLQISMLSGDRKNVVQSMAEELGVSEWHSECSPEDKLSYLQRKNGITGMVGDGINDAPILGGADIAFALASGSYLSQVNSQIVLLNDHVLEIAHTITLSRQAMKIIRQNFYWAIAYNFVMIPLASFGYMTPLMAAIGMSVSSFVVVLNALRVKLKES